MNYLQLLTAAQSLDDAALREYLRSLTPPELVALEYLVGAVKGAEAALIRRVLAAHRVLVGELLLPTTTLPPLRRTARSWGTGSNEV